MFGQLGLLRGKGTEPAFTGAYWDTKDPGLYRCAACHTAEFHYQGKRFRVEWGPHAERRFSALGRRNWTLLVQEVNRHVPDAALLLMACNQAQPNNATEPASKPPATKDPRQITRLGIIRATGVARVRRFSELFLFQNFYSQIADQLQHI